MPAPTPPSDLNPATLPTQMLNSLPFCVAYVSLPDETYRYCNPAYQTWLGKPPAELIGTPIRDFIGEQAYALIHPHCLKAAQGQVTQYEAQIRFPSGKEHAIRVRLFPDTSHGTPCPGCVVMVEDIGNIQLTQAQLLRLNAELEEGIARRTRELEAANDELRAEIDTRHLVEQQLAEHREELAHVARISTLGETATALAHELNQPLAAISNYANAVIKRMQSGDATIEQLEVPLREVASQAERAGNVIRQLREFFRKHETQSIKLKVTPLLEETLSLVQRPLANANITLDYQAAHNLPHIQGDPILFKQVLFNLLRNAIDATVAADDQQDEHRLIKVRAVASPNKKWVQIRVRDWGSGVPQEDLIRIFEPFYTTKKDGMGIGLAIAKRIIEAERGCLSAHRRQPQGLEMIIELPVRSDNELND
ncbi:ATP-binding protein [Mucisphaera sp.]|uniref:ATP-binding protein n=1 Tax=Mucisphaera sp. TaxID=2913024 RepID=UPI003D12C99E